MMNLVRMTALPGILLSLTVSCSTTPPLTYLALEKPRGQIRTVPHDTVQIAFHRGGWYFFNNNFRPAPDVAAYLEQAQKQAASGVLRNADIKLGVPFAFDILCFGYNSGTDTVTAGPVRASD